LDDSFARDVGEFETLAELREQVKKELIIREEQRIQNALHADLVKKILDETPFDAPPSLVNKQTEYLILQARAQMNKQGLQVDSSTMINRELQEAYRPMAEFQVKRSFVLEEIARREGIEVTESETQERLKLLTAAGSQNLSGAARGGETEEAREQIKARVLEDKALAFLKEKAHITIVDKETTA
jgi:trigger factor